MRLVWIMVGVFVLGVGALFAVNSITSHASSFAREARTEVQRHAAQAEDRARTQTALVDSMRDDTPVAGAPPDAPKKTRNEPAPIASESVPGAPSPSPTLAAPASPSAGAPADVPKPAPSPGANPATATPTPVRSAAPAAGSPSPDSTPAPAKPKEEVKPKESKPEVLPGKIEKQADGSLLADGRYVIRGDGTKDSPYRITWDLLTSAEDTYDPKNHKRKIPERIAMLDGKYVRISGYVSFPLQVKEPHECLAMLNQWDGCCIGVPPTPYDAIEVDLSRPVTGDDRYAVAGTVSGRFGVKPYVAGDWLVGLYVMDSGSLSPGEYAPGAGGN